MKHYCTYAPPIQIKNNIIKIQMSTMTHTESPRYIRTTVVLVLKAEKNIETVRK